MRTHWIFPTLATVALNWIDAPMSSWLEKMAQEPVTQGNKIELLVDGAEFYPVLRRMIHDAITSIDIDMFMWCDDDSGLQIAHDLIAAHDRGVRVRIIMDYFNFEEHDRAYQLLERAGIRPLEFNPPYWGLTDLSRHIHEKTFVIDGREAMVGGPNVCDEYLTGTSKKLWHDLEMHLEGPIATRVQHRFDDTWNWMAETEYEVRVGYASIGESSGNGPHIHRSFHVYKQPTPTHDEPVGTAVALYQFQQPYWHSKDSARFLLMYSELIKRATRHVILYDPYFLPPAKFEQALLYAANHHVRVDILTNSAGTNDMGEPITTSQKSHYEGLLKAGAHIYEVQDTTLHAKGILIDETVLTVGSHNFTPRSFANNGEANILTGDPAAIAKFGAMAQYDFAKRAKEITLENVQARNRAVSRNLPRNFWRALLTWLGNIF